MKRTVSVKLGIPLDDVIRQVVWANYERFDKNITITGQKLSVAKGTIYKYIGNAKFQPMVKQ